MICQAKGLSCYLISNLEYEIQTSDPLDVVEILSHFNEITIQIFCCVNDECVNDINSSFKRQEQELLCKRTFAELKLSQNVASLVYLMLFVSYHYSTGNTHTQVTLPTSLHVTDTLMLPSSYKQSREGYFH